MKTTYLSKATINQILDNATVLLNDFNSLVDTIQQALDKQFYVSCISKISYKDLETLSTENYMKFPEGYFGTLKKGTKTYNGSNSKIKELMKLVDISDYLYFIKASEQEFILISCKELDEDL